MQSRRANDDVFISKTLSWLLRHGAAKEGLNISADGYACVTEVLKCRSLKNKCTLQDIERIVRNNNKQRFALKLSEEGVLVIRANQGHSLQCVTDLELQPILKATDCDHIIHGTYYKHWPQIKTHGLNRMNRLHIHFASGLPNNVDVISGMRRNVELFIYIDLEKALNSNLKFFKSANGVILSPGDECGVIAPKYFLKVCDAKSGALLSF